MNTQKVRNRVILTAGALLWMGFIFGMSSQNADISQDLSGGITGGVQRIFFRSWNELPAYDYVLSMTSLSFLIRKAAHFTEYAILGALLASAVFQWIPKFRVSIWYAGIIGLLYAISDEFHQRFVEGRSMQVFDVCIDSLGTAAGALIVCGVMAMVLYANLRKETENKVTP